MSLPTELSFLRVGSGPQTIDMFVDPLCPPSFRMFRSLNENVVPHLKTGGKYEGKMSLIIRLWPQPFHFLTEHLCEALIVFGMSYPDVFWQYLTAVFESQGKYETIKSLSVTGEQARNELVELAVEILDKNDLISGPKSQVYGELQEKLRNKPLPPGKPGFPFNDAAMPMRYLIKLGRQNGIHVSPTAMLNGLEEPSISSSWVKEDWDKYLSEKLGA